MRLSMQLISMVLASVVMLEASNPRFHPLDASRTPRSNFSFFIHRRPFRDAHSTDPYPPVAMSYDDRRDSKRSAQRTFSRNCDAVQQTTTAWDDSRRPPNHCAAHSPASAPVSVRRCSVLTPRLRAATAARRHQATRPQRAVRRPTDRRREAARTAEADRPAATEDPRRMADPAAATEGPAAAVAMEDQAEVRFTQRTRTHTQTHRQVQPHGEWRSANYGTGPLSSSITHRCFP